jgi:hypothetical protein
LFSGYFSRRWGGEDRDYSADNASKLLHAVRIASAVAGDVN